MKKVLYPLLIVLAAAVSSCVYPFELETEAVDEILVIEGDIVPGSSSEVILSYVSPVTNDPNVVTRVPSTAVVRIEVDTPKAEGGTLYYEVTTPERRDRNGLVYIVRLTDPNLFQSSNPGAHQYRLVVENGDNGRTYASEWMRLESESVSIRSLYARLTEDQSAVDIFMDFKGHGGYYRISYKEDWKYTAMYQANCTYNPPPQGSHSVGTISMIPLNRYECWSHNESFLINLVENEGHSDNNIDGYLVRKIGRSDSRLSVGYRIDVQINSISSNAYLYYQHLKDVTEFDGSLFSPNPSEMRGNIRCLEDPDEMVIGYVDIVRTAKIRKYFSAKELPDYIPPKLYYDTEIVTVPASQWYQYYKQGYLPFNYDPDQGVAWANKRCIDCTLSGGTTVKPADWIY